MKRRHLISVSMAERVDDVTARQRLRVVRLAEYTAYERARKRKEFAAAVAGVCFAVLFVGAIVALVWP